MTKNNDPNKYGYSRYGIAFDVRLIFLLANGEFGVNVFNSIKDRGGCKKTLLTSSSYVISTNVGLSPPKKFLAFSFKPFATLT